MPAGSRAWLSAGLSKQPGELPRGGLPPLADAPRDMPDLDAEDQEGASPCGSIQAARAALPFLSPTPRPGGTGQQGVDCSRGGLALPSRASAEGINNLIKECLKFSRPK